VLNFGLCELNKKELRVGADIALACVGAGISLVGVFQYFVGIVKGGTRPRLASWIAWMTANAVFTAVALMDHSYLAASINGIAGLCNVAIIAAALAKKQGDKPQGTTDWSCLASSLACLLMLVLFPENKLLGAYFAMCANALATWPTVVHTWQRPREETWQLFAGNSSANILGLVSVILGSGFHLATAAGPLMGTIGSSTMLMIAIGRGWLTRAEQAVEAEVQQLEGLLEEPKPMLADE
jgi:hypothetical protein